jgi:hypothetical protein
MNLNFDDLPGGPTEAQPSEHRPYVPWAVVERAAKGDPEAEKYIARKDAAKLVDERETAYLHSENQLI